MKKILFISLAFIAVLSLGCGGRGNASKDKIKTKAVGVVTDPHDHGHDHDGHDHSHAKGEPCGHDHAINESHDHATHAGHDHEDVNHAAHVGHDHGAHACQDHSSHDGHDHGEGVSEDPDEIVFPASQAARTEFEVKIVERGDFREVITCGGQIGSAQNEMAIITAPVSGVVTLAGGNLLQSSPVRQGQELFRLSSAGLASGDAILKARVTYNQAAADFERIKGLYEDKLVTHSEYLAAEAEYLRAKAEYDPVSVSDGRGGTTIASPSDGYITQLLVSSGDYVEMGQPMAGISRSNRMTLTANVSQRYYNRLAGISDANFRVASEKDYHTVSAMGGKVHSVGRMVSKGSTLIPVVFEFNNDGTLLDGSVVQVSLLGGTRRDVVAIPMSALTEQQGLYYVYEQLDADCYRRLEVKPGADDGISVEVLSGLKGGERIVTKGAVNVKMASASEAIPHGHSH